MTVSTASPSHVPTLAGHRVALITNELAGVTLSGGIGAAFHELALGLAESGAVVDLVLVANGREDKELFKAHRQYASRGVTLLAIDPAEWIWGPFTAEKLSTAAYLGMRTHFEKYDSIHFADYQGLGFVTLSARECGLVSRSIPITIQLHGPTRWTLDANFAPFSHVDQLKIDFMERESIRLADSLVSPSDYLSEWIASRFETPSRVTTVIKNMFTPTATAIRDAIRESTPAPARSLVFYGRHEERKGLNLFCQAIDLVHDELRRRGTSLVFLGNFARNGGFPSGAFLYEKLKGWSLPFTLLPGLDRLQATSVLEAAENAAVFIPSPVENSPYTVLESILAGRPTFTSVQGGAAELIAEEDRHRYSFEPNPADIARVMLEVTGSGPEVGLNRPPRLASSRNDTLDAWVRYESSVTAVERHDSVNDESHPLVTVAIVHFERPEFLPDALFSALRQDYQNIEIVVVDDGSRSSSAHAVLAGVENLGVRAPVRLVRRENGYLGAARNTAIAHSNGEFVVFLDDDDVLLPGAVSTLVAAQRQSGADVVVPLNVYMERAHRETLVAKADIEDLKISYVPLGGPISAGAVENVFGSATSLIRRASLVNVGGYTEMIGVGHEDYELYIRLASSGAKLVLLPEVAFLYQVGFPSMIATTSPQKNFRRISNVYKELLLGGAALDGLELLAGRQAHEVALGRSHWTLSSDPLRRPFLPLIQGDPSQSEQLRILGEVALERGDAEMQRYLDESSSAVERIRGLDLKGLLSKENPGSPHHESHVVASLNALGDFKVRRRMPPASASTQDLAQACLLGAGGEPEEAAEGLRRWVAGVERVSVVDLSWLRRLDWSLLTGIMVDQTEIFKRVQEVLYWDDVCFAEDLDAYLSDVIDAKVPGDSFEKLLSRDEEAYLAMWPDVREAVADRIVMSGVDHFTRFGFIEGRAGFIHSKGYSTLAGTLMSDFPGCLSRPQSRSAGVRVRNQLRRRGKPPR